MRKYELPTRSWMILFIFLFYQSALATIIQADTTAFVNVTVIPMDSSYTLPDYTVIVENDKIIALGPSETIAIPEHSFRINSQGKFLMPGLIDMHVHTPIPVPGSGFDMDMILFIANGVTTVRNMWGDVPDLEARERIKSGVLFGPTYYTTCPIIDGSPPVWQGSIVATSPAQAREIVKQQKDLGYNFIKIYDNLLKSVYDAIISEAKNQSIPVVGHVPLKVGLEHVLNSGQKSIEHFKGYMDFFGYPWPKVAVWEEMDSTKMNYIISKTLQSTTWNCPTLVAYKNQITQEEFDRAVQERPYLQYVQKEIIKNWRPGQQNEVVKNWIRTIRTNAFYKKLIKALHERGAKILLGTDCLNPFTVAGFSLHQELQLFVEAGLTPYDAIKAGTYNAAEFLDALDEFGTVTVGKRADLVLVNENPLDDVQNILDRVGVMVRGKWFTEAQLQDSLKKVENTWNPTGVISDELGDQPPLDYTLFQNYPNPFNPITAIEYNLPWPVHVRLIIYDLLGRSVKTLVDTRQQSGHFQTTWNSTDEHNLSVAAGVYFCRMEAGEFVKVIKLLLVK